MYFKYVINVSNVIYLASFFPKRSLLLYIHRRWSGQQTDMFKWQIWDSIHFFFAWRMSSLTCVKAYPLEAGIEFQKNDEDFYVNGLSNLGGTLKCQLLQASSNIETSQLIRKIKVLVQMVILHLTG